MLIDSSTDGKNHINIYSKGKTSLGRFLSNFTKHKINTSDGEFMSIEGYWYWLGCTHQDKDKLRHLYGFKAKKVGRELNAPDWQEDNNFKNKICSAIQKKIETAPPDLYKEFIKSSLPFTHYYTYGKNPEKVIHVPEGQWIIDFITQLRNRLI